MLYYGCHEESGIVNLHNVEDIDAWLRDPNNRYVGRETDKFVADFKWGNPFTLKKYRSREKVLQLFEEYILGNDELKKDLGELSGKVLGCWCYPLKCHAVILRRMAMNFVQGSQLKSVAVANVENVVRTVIVKNIGPDISEQDLVDLFSLKTDNSHRITVVHGSEETTACIEVPPAHYDMVMKLNGVSFKGRDLVLTGSENADHDTAAVPNNDMHTDPVPEEPIQYLELDTRIPEWNFNQVTDIEIVEAIEEEFPDDFSKSVEDLGRYRKNLQGIFRVDSDDYSHYQGKTLTIRQKEIPFRPKYQRKNEHSSGPTYGGRREGTLITIYGAFRTPHRGITNDEFDEYFTNLQVEVIKPTEPQVKKRTSVLNNNRYLVVQKLDDDEVTKNRIKNSIVVHGKKFNIAYNGMKKHCFLCGRAHEKDCPTRARFEHLKALRDKKPRRRAVYSDSVLAHVNQLATTADFACMSGGGIGQIINAIPHDSKHEQVTIAAGTNEIVHAVDAKEYVFTIDRSLEKLRALAEEVETSFVMPSLDLPSPQMKARYDYLENELAKIPAVKIIKPENVEMDEIHPTENGTKSIVQALHAHFNDVILEEAEADDLTTKRYLQVRSLYKVGCRTCRIDELTPYLCEGCKGQCSDVSTDAYDVLLEKAENDMFPKSGKRNHESSDDDETPAKR